MAVARAVQPEWAAINPQPRARAMRQSAFGKRNQYGMEGARFWTRTKLMTQRWPSGGSDFIIPTRG
ncbi:MAG: hypothetical protein ABW048_13160 [Sphingobium sp.]